MKDTLIILGASARAAATSALRAGWTPWCADLFADADLERIAPVRKVPGEAYPHGLIDALKDAPPGPVLYTGALENRPDLIARIDRPLLGNGAEVLRAVRTPAQWTKCLRDVGVPCPALANAPTAGRWLLKPRKSAAGAGIAPYEGQPFQPHTHYLQEWIDGVPCSGIFLGNRLLGVTQQLIGAPWLNATGFHYAGNIGPLPLDDTSVSRWSAIGEALVTQFKLVGLFGVDAVVRDGVVWPIEINPRYTASMELLERCYGEPLLPTHASYVEHSLRESGPEKSHYSRPFLCSGGITSNDRSRGTSALPVCGKAILYARNTITFPVDGPWHLDGVDLDRTAFADLPHAGDIIEQGRPVLTRFASGSTANECLANLQENAQALDRMLFG